jgi:hypothetical protein
MKLGFDNNVIAGGYKMIFYQASTLPSAVGLITFDSQI